MKRAEGFIPHAAQVAAALSAAVTTTSKARKRVQLAWVRNSEGRIKPIPSRSSGGSAREELLSEKLPPSHMLDTPTPPSPTPFPTHLFFYGMLCII